MAEAHDSMTEAKKHKRTSFFGFFAESYQELKRVRWPKRREIVFYTSAALILCAILGLLIWGFDVGVSRLMSLVGVD